MFQSESYFVLSTLLLLPCVHHNDYILVLFSNTHNLMSYAIILYSPVLFCLLLVSSACAWSNSRQRFETGEQRNVEI